MATKLSCPTVIGIRRNTFLSRLYTKTFPGPLVVLTHALPMRLIIFPVGVGIAVGVGVAESITGIMVGSGVWAIYALDCGFWFTLAAYTPMPPTPASMRTPRIPRIILFTGDEPLLIGAAF